MTDIPILPPENIMVLQARAQAVAGLSLGQLAGELGVDVPADQRKKKGWVGQLLELALGADARNQSLPDFTRLGIELKTLPINAQGKPRETTFVCTIPLLTIQYQQWENSQVWNKLRHVLWVPVEACPSIPLAERRLGKAILWCPNAQQAAILQQDWLEITGMIAMGELELLSGKWGQYLQVRPKGLNGRCLCWGYNQAGDKVQTLPRGFYLRTSLTKQILQLQT
ncbi:MAG: DNA mismatch repair endonuclease MutH [Legionellales bacterium]|nr:DNA mismatch repair endonuclease MutH [Legionellales bacterium]